MQEEEKTCIQSIIDFKNTSKTDIFKCQYVAHTAMILLATKPHHV